MAEAKNLRNILDGVPFPGPLYQSGLDEMLPGLGEVDPLSSNDESKVFQFEDNELSQFEIGHRLGSPSHWRLYFAFDQPSYAVSDAEFRAFRATAAKDWTRGAEILTQLAQRSQPSVGYHLDVFLERLAGEKSEFSAEEGAGIAEIFAEFMDLLGKVDFPVGTDPWRRSFRLLGPHAASIFPELCKRGRSICWLAAALRDQAFAFGLIDSPETSPERLWLDRNEFDSSVEALQARLDEMRFRQVLDMPEPVHALLFLLQVGNKQKLKDRMEAAFKDDMMFLRFLGRLRATVHSSDRGTYRPLQREMVTLFMDYENALKRVKALVETVPPNGGVQQTATAILNALEAAKR